VPNDPSRSLFSDWIPCGRSRTLSDHPGLAGTTPYRPAWKVAMVGQRCSGALLTTHCGGASPRLSRIEVLDQAASIGLHRSARTGELTCLMAVLGALDPVPFAPALWPPTTPAASARRVMLSVDRLFVGSCRPHVRGFPVGFIFMGHLPGKCTPNPFLAFLSRWDSWPQRDARPPYATHSRCHKQPIEDAFSGKRLSK